METLLGDKAPILDTLKKLASPLGLSSAIDTLETQLKKAVEPLLEAGAKLPGLNLSKDDGGLESTGYAYIGDNPISPNVSNEFKTIVKLVNEKDK